MLDLESLPESWWRQFVQQLPQHLKLTLRCCSRTLQSRVDQFGVGLVLSSSCRIPIALQLCAGHLTSLHTLRLPSSMPAPPDFLAGLSEADTAAIPVCTPSTAASEAYAFEQGPQLGAAECIRQLPHGLPALKTLTLSVLVQPDLLAAVLDSRPTALTQIKLLNKPGAAGVLSCDECEDCSVLAQLPGKVPNLASLVVDQVTYYMVTKHVHSALRQPLPNLRSLELLPQGQGQHCGVLIPASVWTTVMQPLLSTLTCLHIGQRAAPDQGVPESSLQEPAAAGEAAAIAATAAAAAADGPMAAAAGAASCDATPAAAPPAAPDDSGLGHLLQLKCCGVDGATDTAWNLSWLSSCVGLTSLEIGLCSAGELDCDVLASLRQLQSLKINCFEDEFVSTLQLAPLAACTQLTQLELQALLVELPAADDGAGVGGSGVTVGGEVPRPPDDHTAAAVAGAETKAAGAEGLQPGPTAAAALEYAAAGQGGCGLSQLRSLQRLTAGVMCRAPLSCWMPHLTRLKDLDYDLDVLDLPGSFVNEQQPPGQEALARLTELQVLCGNIFALVRHAGAPHNLMGLHELHIDMVGSMDGTCLEPHGLPRLPHLTKLVMYIKPQLHRDLHKTYTTKEDFLLWRNQSAVKHLRIRGSALLGGFLVEPELLQQLPTCLPALHKVEVIRAKDLTLQQLQAFVCARVCRYVLVQGCGASIGDRECVQLQEAVGGQVAVEYGGS